MKRLIVLLTILFSFTLVFNSCGNKQPGNLASDEIYSCPMHPQIVRDNKAQCPICHMDLEKRKMTPAEMQKAKKEHGAMHNDSAQ